METMVDERGRVLIPLGMRRELGLDEGTAVELEKAGQGVLVTPAKRRRLSWKDLHGMRPERTGKPEWPAPKEIKGIWE